jgi:hypothetical protein
MGVSGHYLSTLCSPLSVFCPLPYAACNLLLSSHALSLFSLLSVRCSLLSPLSALCSVIVLHTRSCSLSLSLTLSLCKTLRNLTDK